MGINGGIKMSSLFEFTVNNVHIQICKLKINLDTVGCVVIGGMWE
jgi:hypothetical protein